jgi:hypothetical protein
MDVTEFISQIPHCILDHRHLVQLFVDNPSLATLVAHPIPNALEAGALLLAIVAWCNSQSLSLASLLTSRIPNFLRTL